MFIRCGLLFAFSKGEKMDQDLIALGVTLTELAIKGTASTISKKIATIKQNKNLEETRNAYEEIINELISEKEEAVRIAQSYKAEYERVNISENDITHLHKTIDSLLTLFGKSDDPTFQKAKSLISVDMLKTVQLLGFNYKEAIGVPLTKLCSDKIFSMGKTHNNAKK
jgi:ElaB/YqjD/DUF883 family membrane-anchored ribosome-binding protein